MNKYSMKRFFPTHHSLSPTAKLWLLAGLLALLILIVLFAGRYPSVGFLSLSALKTDKIAQRLFLNLRIPRILLGLLLGASLGASGFVFQNVFNNPLVGAGMLGVTQGAAFGAAMGIVFFHANAWVVQLLAVSFGISGIFLAVFTAKRIHYGGWILRLILAGSVISALFSSGLALLKVLADGDNQLHAIEFWLMGGLGFTTWRGLLPVILIASLSLFVLYRFRWRINLLSLPEESVFSLGVDAKKERILLLLLSVFAVAAVTSLSGIIGWVGLIVPHASRRIFGADASFSLPGSILLGSLLIVICDHMIRIFSPIEMPLGIFTALVGVILFVLLMKGKR